MLLRNRTRLYQPREEKKKSEEKRKERLKKWEDTAFEARMAIFKDKERRILLSVEIRKQQEDRKKKGASC